MPKIKKCLGRRIGESEMHLSPLGATAAVRSKAVVLLLLINCFVAASLAWQPVSHLSFVVWLYILCHLLSSDHLMHGRGCLLELGCVIFELNVFGVLMCRALTTINTRVKVWRRSNAFNPPPP